MVQNITDFDPNWAFPDYRPVAAFKSLRFALFVLVFFFDGVGVGIAEYMEQFEIMKKWLCTFASLPNSLAK